MPENTLYYGDNLDILRRYVADESVDLVYLDPPFNSNATYNVLFAEQDGARAAAQIKAFKDTWRWDQGAVQVYQSIVEAGGAVSEAMQAFRRFLGQSNMLAYLAMMAPRLVELRRALKSTGSMYLHCDPTASHYLKILADSVFGVQNYRNEIIWKRTHAHGSAVRYGPVHDVVLFYSKSDEYVWTGIKAQHDPEYVEKHFRSVDAAGRRFQAISLTGPGVRHGDSGKPWRGVDPTAVQRHWAIPGHVVQRLGLAGESVQERLDALDEAGRVYWPEKGGTPRLRWYADELEGVAPADVITDIGPIGAQAAERLGYPTQKPLQLLRRFVAASSRPGNIVLDPFCGCGTTIDAVEQLNREHPDLPPRSWIGIDITHLAINLIKHRLHDRYAGTVQYRVVGEPVSVPDAQELADHDPFQFQLWALGLVHARPAEGKRGADRGIDGRLYFHDEGPSGKTKQIVFSVKSGHVGVAQVRDLRGVVEREQAAIGVLISMDAPTQPMRAEAAEAGLYDSAWGSRHPRLQILTIEELLRGRNVDLPRSGDMRTFKKAQKAKTKGTQGPKLNFGPHE